ncbi:hypothetical protein [Microcoleus sp. Z1_B5]|uniref:hypothetical protein n=1 Tax=Microcoleus sp. Z1_B5 TaxID=3055430 RepID=UPI002FD7553E
MSNGCHTSRDRRQRANAGVADLRYEKLNMQVIEISIRKASGASTNFFHTLIKQHLM